MRGVVKMRKLFNLIVFSFTTIILVACNNEMVSESDLEAFVNNYKKDVYNIALENEVDDLAILANVEPYTEAEIFNRNKTNSIYVFPKYFATENDVNISLENTKIDSFEQEDSVIDLKYTLTLKIGEEEVEKKGTMTISVEDKENFIITYDYEVPIIVNGKKLM